MIMRTFVLNVTLMAVIEVEWVVRVRVWVIKGMESGVLRFRMCHMHWLILDFLVNYLMLRIVFLLVKNGGIHMHSRVEKRKWFVINWLFVLCDIGPVVFRLVMRREASSNIEVNFSLHSCLVK